MIPAVVLAVMVAAIVATYAAGQLLFTRDDKHWITGWREFCAANVPRPSNLGNVAPHSTAHEVGSTAAADVAAGEAATDEAAADE